MAVNYYELELQTQIVLWQTSRPRSDGLIRFTVNRGHIQMRMNGLVWSIEALPLPGTMDYTFNNIRCTSDLIDLPFKFNLLLVTLQMYIRSVFRLRELLDKLYACSRFLSQGENDKRWWIIIDAEVMAVACKTATEATEQAAEAAAAYLAEVMEPPEYFPRQNIITEELWAPSFSAKEIWNRIAQAAVDGGDVLQWCKFKVLELDKMIPGFEFEVAVQDFLQGNDEVSKIGVVNSHALKVTVGLEDKIWVVCSQEGVKTETSLGLGSLLPQLIRNYIETAVLETNEWKDGVDNIAEGLVQRVIGYLTFLPRVCEFCGSRLLLENSLTSFCNILCEARQNICRDSLPLKWATDGQWNMEAAQQGLSTLLLTDDDDDDWNENTEDLFDDDDDDDGGNENADHLFN